MTAALGALAELVQNLDALTVGGSQNRWFYPRRLRHSATIHFRTAWPPAVRSRRATESEHSIKLSINQSSFELPSFPCMQNASPKASAWRTVHPPAWHVSPVLHRALPPQTNNDGAFLSNRAAGASVRAGDSGPAIGDRGPAPLRDWPRRRAPRVPSRPGALGCSGRQSKFTS
ncbi:hypothetical protein ACCO45_005014 [Purpureocillium lilacinum]|uniref:Uncharacterized protein n=1 Tax=Purpureocillium lilacinum TaxID=33203 RepID=A0ACC4DVF3_PURLI